MKINIKDFGVDLEIKNRGIELGVSDPKGKHLGDLYVTGTQLIWCRGRTTKNNGVSVDWQTFIDYMEDDGD